MLKCISLAALAFAFAGCSGDDGKGTGGASSGGVSSGGTSSGGTSSGGTSSGGTSSGGTNSGGTNSGGAAGGPPTSTADFDTRCAEPGVLVCVGWDDPKNFEPGVYPDSGIYPAGDDVFRGTMDSATKASGAGSLKFEIPTKSGANMAGQWHQTFQEDFGEESTFYVQFRQRFSPEMLSIDWDGLMGTSFKQAIFHHDWASCAAIEITTVNYYASDIPILYTDCGARAFYTNDGNPPMDMQQGDYNCAYGDFNPTDCLYYQADKWMTFYYRVSIGHFGQADSTVQAWVAMDGQPYEQFVDIAGFVLYPNNEPATAADTYNALSLTPYMTAKDESVDHPTAYTWYDELIISKQPIAPPAD